MSDVVSKYGKLSSKFFNLCYVNKLLTHQYKLANHLFFLQMMRLIRFYVAGFNIFLASYRYILVVVPLQELTVFFLQITVFLLHLWACYDVPVN